MKARGLDMLLAIKGSSKKSCTSWGTCVDLRKRAPPRNAPPGLTPEGERIRGRFTARFLPCSTRRKELAMSVAEQLGLRDATSGLLALADQRWGLWATVYPALTHCRGVSSEAVGWSATLILNSLIFSGQFTVRPPCASGQMHFARLGHWAALGHGLHFQLQTQCRQNRQQGAQ